jgi:LmbE family N-acetylglucosaminyl deacetylase
VSALGPPEIGRLEPCDSLYVSPHADDVFLSCPARLLQDQARGAKVLIVTLFDDAGRSQGAPVAGRAGFLSRPGIQHLEVGLPAAPARHPAYSTFRGLTQGRQAVDEDSLGRAVELLADIGHRTRAREIYVPLGVGQHIDHRLAHEASRSAFMRGEGRNVFLYEERPEAFVPGAVRVRLSQVGARLPPGAVEAADRAGLARLLVRFHVAPTFRGDLKGWGDRLRSAALAARQWRESRAWHPLKGFGPRLQPVVYPAAEAPPEARDLIGPASSLVEKLGRAYASAVGGAAYAERYWLLLPPRQADGLESLPAVVGEESRDA